MFEIYKIYDFDINSILHSSYIFNIEILTCITFDNANEDRSKIHYTIIKAKFIERKIKYL